MRKLFILLLFLCCKVAFPQLTIKGPWIVPKGSTITYDVYGAPGGAIISWSVGGALSWSGGQNTCDVTWPDEYGVGDLTVTDDLYGYSTTIHVLIGGHFLSPQDQILDWGQSPQPIYCNYAEGQPNFEWEKKNAAGEWEVISGANLATLYHVEAGSTVNTYRARIYLNGESYLSNEATIQYKQMDPGAISLPNPPLMGAMAVINSTPVSGGMCYPSQYQYTWEASVEDGPWRVIGNAEQYPSNAPPIIGDTRIRRKIVCGGTTYYSNTLMVKPAYTFADAENRNYVRTYTIATAGISSRYQAADLETGKKFQETVYFDGLGRTIQTVTKGVSKIGSTWGDLVSFQQYDNLGRPTKQFLPYPTTSNPGKFKTNTTEQATYYSTNYNESSPWVKVDIEDNPTRRVAKVIDANTYQQQNNIGNTISYDYNNSNNTTENIRIWNIGYESDALPVSAAGQVYTTGVLLKTVNTNESGKKVIEYNDLSGNIILKKVQLAENAPALTSEHDGWLCTYYVYDDFGQLRYIITPKAVKYLQANNWVLTAAIAAELCYSYEYDEKGRAIIKQSPGAGKQAVIYDLRNRVVFTQDAVQAAKPVKEWMATLYDQLDRVSVTGIYKSNQTPVQLQAAVDAMLQLGVVTIPGGTAVNDLVVPSRQSNQTPSRYAAVNSIEFLPEFTSLENDEFVAEIDPMASSENISIPVLLAGNSVIDQGNTATFTALTYHYYDNYNYANAKPFNNSFANYQAYANGTADLDVIQTTNRITGKTTGTKVRVLGTEKFLVSTVYYDNKGRIIQMLSDNIKNKSDVVTMQYHYDGRLMSEHTIHTAENSYLDGFSVLKKNTYDKIGNLLTLEKKFGPNAFKKLSAFEYDEFNRIKSKSIGDKPGMAGTPIESQQITYNATGDMIGINKDFALSSSEQDQWNHYFGIYLGYDNSANRFARTRYDKMLTGVIWKSQGDNAIRKYDFTYDNANRLIGADFSQKLKPSELAWSSAKFDFSETGITYDENDNIKTLNRKGIIPGSSAPVYIDKLEYSYLQVNGQEWSNKLLKIFDNNPEIGSAGNGLLGDFKDETWGVNGNDYVYDEIGNLVIDQNKKIRNGASNGIVYNVMNKIEKITLENKSIVEFAYDAMGNKISRKLTPVNGVTKTTYYIGEFIYSDNEPELILHEEGRIRMMTPVSATTGAGVASIEKTGNIQLVTGKWGVYDYFLKDHQGNTRMVVTEEYHKEMYKASVEEAAAAEEEAFFGKVDGNTGAPLHPGNELYDTRVDKPAIWSSNSSAKVMKLFSTGTPSGKSIGANMMIRVMGGDNISATTKYYFDIPSSQPASRDILTSIVTSLIGGLTGDGVSNAVKSGSAYLQTSLQTVGGPITSFMGGRPTPQGLGPKAYVNYMFFDENFNYISEASGASVVGMNGNDNSITIPNLKAPNNGYAYVFLSNDSEWPVYFDDFVVAHERGAIIEESHYYPHGLKIAGISSKAFDKPANRFGFQSSFSEEEDEAGWNIFNLRTYDSQTGRWLQVDPFDEFSSPYVGMGADPVNNVDPTGGSLAGTVGALAGTAVGLAAPYIYEAVTGNHVENKGLIGLGIASLTSAAGYGFSETFFTGDGTVLVNMKAFYAGLFGSTNGSVYTRGWSGLVKPLNGGSSAIIPDIWGSIGNFFSGLGDIFAKSRTIVTEAAPPITAVVIQEAFVPDYRDNDLPSTKIGGPVQIETKKPGYVLDKIPVPEKKKKKKEDGGKGGEGGKGGNGGGGKKEKEKDPPTDPFVSTDNGGLAIWSSSLSLNQINFADGVIKAARGSNPRGLTLTFYTTLQKDNLRKVQQTGSEYATTNGRYRVDQGDGGSNMLFNKIKTIRRPIQNNSPGLWNIESQAANLANYIGTRLGLDPRNVNIDFRTDMPANRISVTLQ